MIVIVSSVHDLRECSLAFRRFAEEKVTHQAESLPCLDCENLGVSGNRPSSQWPFESKLELRGLTRRPCVYFQ